MTGREDSVIERFRKDLRTSCVKTGKVDMNAPVNGADRHFNADEFFAVDGRFFIVEFKSSKHNLKDEERKTPACVLCGRLSQSPNARALHDRGHFAAWGKKQPNSNLNVTFGIYRILVCSERTLPNCRHVKGVFTDEIVYESAKLLDNITNQKAGLNAEEFKCYLKWLLNHNKDEFFPHILFGYTYTEGVFDREFSSYDDFSKWATTAVEHARKLDSIKKHYPGP